MYYFSDGISELPALLSVMPRHEHCAPYVSRTRSHRTLFALGLPLEGNAKHRDQHPIVVIGMIVIRGGS